jgi:hypothetical protein
MGDLYNVFPQTPHEPFTASDFPHLASNSSFVDPREVEPVVQKARKVRRFTVSPVSPSMPPRILPVPKKEVEIPDFSDQFENFDEPEESENFDDETFFGETDYRTLSNYNPDPKDFAILSNMEPVVPASRKAPKPRKVRKVTSATPVAPVAPVATPVTPVAPLIPPAGGGPVVRIMQQPPQEWVQRLTKEHIFTIYSSVPFETYDLDLVYEPLPGGTVYESVSKTRTKGNGLRDCVPVKHDGAYLTVKPYVNICSTKGSRSFVFQLTLSNGHMVRSSSFRVSNRISPKNTFRPDAIHVLQKLEWCPTTLTCHICGQAKSTGHHSTCALSKLLPKTPLI